MITDSPVDDRIYARADEGSFSASYQKPHIRIPRLWRGITGRVITGLVITALVLQLPAPALVKASVPRVVPQPAGQVKVPFKAVNRAAPVIPEIPEPSLAKNNTALTLLYDKPEEDDGEGVVKV